MDVNENIANGNVSGEENQASSSKKEATDVTTAKFKVSQVKRQDAQRNAFTRWVNSKLKQDKNATLVTDIFNDLRDGNNLLSLLEVLTGRKTARVKGKLRLHKINNINVALDLLKEYKVKLVNIGNTDIVDGLPIPTLGLIWSMIYRFQIQGALIDILPGDKSRSSGGENAEKAILAWCAKAVEGYEGVEVKNFSSSWKDGLAFNALIHRYKPNLFHYESSLNKTPAENLEHAFMVAENAFGVHRLLEPSDLDRDPIDSRLVVMYVSTLYEKLKELDPKSNDTVSMEEIDEFLSYIKEELDYLNGCQEFFENASNAPPANDEDLVNQYQDLIGFIDDLQPHQLRVSELVIQIESLIDSNLIPVEESESLQKALDVLKDIWQDVFDKTSNRQERLRGLLLNVIDEPLISVKEQLDLHKNKMKDFSHSEDDLPKSFEQFVSLLDFIDDLRKVESEIEDIRTGNVCGDAIAVLSDEDEATVSNSIKELIDEFTELGQDVAETKHKLNEHVYELLKRSLGDIGKEIEAAQKLTTENNNNNNNTLDDGDLKNKLGMCIDIQSRLHDMQPDVDNISSICVQLDENFDNEEMSLNELKQKAVDLEEDHAEQLRLLADFIEKLHQE